MLMSVVLFALGLLLICFGGDHFVEAAVAIARKIGIPEIVVGAAIVSLGTTLPEVLVSTNAALNGSAAVAAGNAFGSIICNTALIAGLTQTIRPVKQVETRALLWRLAIFFIWAGLLGFMGFHEGEYTRSQGGFLLIMFVFYLLMNILDARKDSKEIADETKGKDSSSVLKDFVILIICAALLYIGSDLLVDNGIIIAEKIGVPERVIAVTFIALGTSLPELVTSIISIVKGFANVGLGNILGANILNLLAVIGIPSALAGIKLEESVYLIDVPLGILVMAILFIPVLLKKRAYRIQGILLLLIYMSYCVISFI